MDDVEHRDELLTLADIAEGARHFVLPGDGLMLTDCQELPGDGLMLTPSKQAKHMRGRASMVRRAASAQSCHRPSWPTFPPCPALLRLKALPRF